jgi:deoxyribonuclease-2
MEDKGNKYNYFFWNDDMSLEDEEEKFSASMGKAHSKGGLIFDEKEGVHLLHTLPRFPRRKSDGQILQELPDNAGIYGQTFICLSVSKESSVKIIETLNVINPQLVSSVEKDLVDETNDIVNKFIKNRGDSKLPSTKITEIETTAKNKFVIFSKGKKFADLPYDSLLPEYYKDGFYVQTWTKPNRLESECKATHKIVNVMTLKFKDFTFTHNQEHSKWAVSMTKDVCCFGDLNRTGSQKKRGGNTICFENKNLSIAMRDAIIEKEDCKKKTNAFLELLD